MGETLCGYHDYLEALKIIVEIKDKKIRKLILPIILLVGESVRRADKAIQVEFTGTGWSNYIPGFWVGPNQIFVDGDQIPRLSFFNKKNMKTLAVYFNFSDEQVDMLGHVNLEQPVGFQGSVNLPVAVEWLKRT